jgi:hypothetical protein
MTIKNSKNFDKAIYFNICRQHEKEDTRRKIGREGNILYSIGS